MRDEESLFFKSNVGRNIMRRPSAFLAFIAMVALPSASLALERAKLAEYKQAKADRKTYEAKADPAFTTDIAKDADNRILHHLKYDQVPLDFTQPLSTELWSIDKKWRTPLNGDWQTYLDGRRSYKTCDLRLPAAQALEGLMEDADKYPVSDGLKLYAFSCFRSEDQQVRTFCGLLDDALHCQRPRLRSAVSAPPGYSEHATGYTLDFVVLPVTEKGAEWYRKNWCGSSPCPAIANTDIGKWLLLNAPKHGFELSFPAGNRQGVCYEPWHWRWVGANPTDPAAPIDPDARKARTQFDTARREFPASPGLPDSSQPQASNIASASPLADCAAQ